MVIQLSFDWGRFLSVIKGKENGSHTILLIRNQYENDRTIITFSKYKDCSNSFQFAHNSKPTPIEATLH